jgi:hypothetical protein
VLTDVTHHLPPLLIPLHPRSSVPPLLTRSRDHDAEAILVQDHDCYSITRPALSVQGCHYGVLLKRSATAALSVASATLNPWQITTFEGLAMVGYVYVFLLRDVARHYCGKSTSGG